MIKRFIEDDAGWIAYLNHQIDKELDKDPREQDWDRIEEYRQALDEASKGKYDPDPDIKEEKLNELRKLYHKKVKARGLRTKHPRWIPGAVAACFLLVILGFPVTSAAINHMSPVDIIRQWGKKLLNLPYDVPVEESGITFIRHGDVTTYTSLEDLLEAEDFHILYPAWLPGNTSVEQVVCFSVNEKDSLIFDLSNENISFSIEFTDDIDGIFEGYTSKVVAIDGKESSVYLFEMENLYTAKFVFEGALYKIGSNEESVLFEIIRNLTWR